MKHWPFNVAHVCILHGMQRMCIARFHQFSRVIGCIFHDVRSNCKFANLEAHYSEKYFRSTLNSVIFLHMKKNDAVRGKDCGFTLIELMVVVAIIAILGLMAMPSFYYRNVREQIESIALLTAVAEAPIASAWTLTQTMPANNSAAGLPVPEKMVDNYVSSIQIQNGAVNVTFGNHATTAISGKILTFRPAVISDSPIVPVTWVCGSAAAPKNMTIMGVNQTTIPAALLPLNCK